MLDSLVRRLAGPLAAVTVAVSVVLVPSAASADPTGTFDLTLTEANGQPARSASVILFDAGQSLFASGSTDAAGHLSLPVSAGSFEVSVTPTFARGGLNFGRQQYLHGKVPPAAPDIITIASGATTTVAEQLLEPGALAVTARDAVTGAAISNFCVSHVAGGECTPGSGPITVSEVRPGPSNLDVSVSDGGYLPANVSPVVVSGQTVPVTVDLRPAGRVATSIVAADTGAPLEGACIALVKAGTAVLPDGTGDCTDASGQLTVAPVEPGDYHVFVKAAVGSGYGAQWVGRTGGVGQATRARTITVAAGGTTTAPTIRLDRAGTISGVVGSEAGLPITFGSVSLHAFNRGGPSFSVDIDGQGAYSIDWLGPYEWPLLFGAQGHARQWSGGEANRREAELITVRSGQTTTYSPALRVGTVLTGTVTDTAGQPLVAEFDLVNQGTGEDMGGGFSPDGTYRTLVLGPQNVRLSWFAGGKSGWYDNATDFASATRIPIPRQGTKTLNLVLNV